MFYTVNCNSLSFQPRILMAMARDGLLPSFFADINRHTQVPVNSTVITGVLAAALAFFMDVSQLAGMVSQIVIGIVIDIFGQNHLFICASLSIFLYGCRLVWVPFLLSPLLQFLS